MHSNNSLSTPSVAGYRSTPPLPFARSQIWHRPPGSQGEAIAHDEAIDSRPDGRSLGAHLLYLNLPNDIPGPGAHCRVSVARFKPCTNPHNTTNLPRYLPAGLSQHVLNNYTTKSPPVHATADDVSVPAEYLEIDKMPATSPYKAGAESSPFSSLCRHLGNVNWTSSTPQHILEYWAGAPQQLRQANRVYCYMCVGAAQRELSLDKDPRVLPPGYSYVNGQTWTRRFSDTIPPVVAHVLVLGSISSLVAHTSTLGQCVVRFLDDSRAGLARAIVCSVHYGS